MDSEGKFGACLAMYWQGSQSWNLMKLEKKGSRRNAAVLWQLAHWILTWCSLRLSKKESMTKPSNIGKARVVSQVASCEVKSGFANGICICHVFPRWSQAHSRIIVLQPWNLFTVHRRLTVLFLCVLLIYLLCYLDFSQRWCC